VFLFAPLLSAEYKASSRPFSTLVTAHSFGWPSRCFVMPPVFTTATTAHHFLSTPVCCALAVVSCLVLVVSSMATAYGLSLCVRRFRTSRDDDDTDDIEVHFSHTPFPLTLTAVHQAQVAELKALPSSPDIPASIIKLLAVSQHSHIPIVTDAVLSSPIPTIPRFADSLSPPEGSRFISYARPPSLKIDIPVDLRTRRLLVEPYAFTPSRLVPPRPPPLYTLPVRRCPSSMWADCDMGPVTDGEPPLDSTTASFAVITREKVLGLVKQSAHIPLGSRKTKYKEKTVESWRIASAAK
jgi:hypothetical protein